MKVCGHDLTRLTRDQEVCTGPERPEGTGGGSQTYVRRNEEELRYINGDLVFV